MSPPAPTHARNVAGMRFALLSLSCLACLAIFVAVLHAHYRDHAHELKVGRPAYGIEGDYFIPDTTLGWRLTPSDRGSVVDTRSGKTSSFYSTDARGFRGGDGAPRAEVEGVVLGDSMVQGYWLADDETMPAELSRLAEGTVLNLGVGGYSTDQEYLLLRSTFANVKPRWVAVVFFANDLPYLDKGEAWGYAKPCFTIKDGIVDFDQPPSAVPVSDVRTAPANRVEPFDPRRASRAYTIECARRALGLFRHPVRTWNRLFRRDAGTMELPREAYGDPRALAREWNLAFQFLHRMKTETESRGARFLVVFLPEFAQARDETIPSALQEAFVAGCASNGIPCLEPLAEIRAGQRVESLYFLDDGHLSPHGAKFLADLVAPALRPDTSNGDRRRE
jgi:hypothetical protein